MNTRQIQRHQVGLRGNFKGFGKVSLRLLIQITLGLTNGPLANNSVAQGGAG